MKFLLIGLILLLTGCANSSDFYFDDTIRIRQVNAETTIPYASPKYSGVSVQTKGKIDYDFYIYYETQDTTIELSNDGVINTPKFIGEKTTLRY